MNKINPWFIIKDHIKTLRDDRDGEQSLSDLFFFFFIPLIISIIMLFCFKLFFNVEIVKTLLTIMSISVPLLLNLLILLYEVGQSALKDERNNSKSQDRIFYVNETCSNISFAILLSIIEIIILFISLLNPMTLEVVSFISYNLLGIVLLTILMILKRTHILIKASF